MLPNLLARLAAFSARRAVPVVLLAALLAIAGVAVTRARLDVTTDTGGLFSVKLPWRQQQERMKKAFPQGEDLLVAVVAGDIPEEAEATAAGLAAALAPDRTHFKLVTRPDSNAYLRRNALLFLKPDKLEPLLDSTIDAQPFLGQLAADPSARGLFGALGLIADGVKAGQANLASFAKPLHGFADALTRAADGHPAPLSWQRLLAGDLNDMGSHYRFVSTQPRLDYGSFAPGGNATAAMRKAIDALPFVKSGQAHVFLTGQVALDDEEFSTVAEGAVAGLIGSLLLVVMWLFLAVRSWRLILPIVAVLLLGLLLTTAFAALAVGTLNLISVAFAILFVGIAVDFGIQFSVRFREYYRPGADGVLPSREAALGLTGRRAGVQILIASLATAAGFMAFTPTAFIGVAQLGLIAGTGMLIAFVCTLTVLPALLSLCHPTPHAAEVGFAALRHADGPLARHRRPVLAAAAALAVLGLALLPVLRFDGDPLHTKDPNSPSVKALQLLLADPVSSPYSAELLLPDLKQADALAARLSAVPLAADVLTLSSFVPEHQAQTLPMVQDAASLLLPTLSPVAVQPAPDAAAIRTAAARADASLAAVLDKLPADSPLRRIQAALDRLKRAPDALLLRANADLVRFLPDQLATLRTALSTTGARIDDIPAQMKRDWLLPDGEAHVEVTVRASAQDNAGLHRFVREVHAIAPGAAGSAVTIVESANTIVTAFKVAALSAIAAIAVILLVMLRRVGDVARVLAPLLLSSLLTVILCVAIPQPLNFANIIALPLLLGVGVSFNIYFVMNWRAGQARPLASPTTRAIVFSALTTGTAFGSLALSHHPGTASMGRLLLLSLGCTLLATLVFVPALLARKGGGGGRV